MACDFMSFTTVHVSHLYQDDERENENDRLCAVDYV